MADDVNSARTRWLGQWKNERGSVMTLSSCTEEAPGSGSGTIHFKISGTYQTAKGDVPFAEEFPLSGFVTKDQIVFSVSYRYVDPAKESRHSLATWAGQILPIPDDPKQEKLQTLWHLVPDLTDGADEDKYGWLIAWSGEDGFTKLS